MLVDADCLDQELVLVLMCRAFSDLISLQAQPFVGVASWPDLSGH